MGTDCRFRAHSPRRFSPAGPSRAGSPRQPSGGGTRGDRFEIPSEGINYETFERDLILQAMEKSDWVIAKASKMLGMSYRTLQYRLDKFNLKKPDGRSGPTL